MSRNLSSEDRRAPVTTPAPAGRDAARKVPKAHQPRPTETNPADLRPVALGAQGAVEMKEEVSRMAMWSRFRFLAEAPDYRPVKWPPLGPYWCSGLTSRIKDEEEVEHSIVIAELPIAEEARLTEFWPEATEIEEAGLSDHLIFTDRFPCPDWWDQEAGRAKEAEL